MINLTLGSQAQGQPFVIQASRRNYPLPTRGTALPTTPRRVRKMDQSKSVDSTLTSV